MAGVDDWGALLPGSRIAGYEIRRKLGQGGFGIAYEGFNADLRLKAAIKEFFPRDFVGRSGTAVSVREKGSEEFYQRFLNRFIEEARAVHRLDHPHIVKVRHFERANNTAYVVMDYIDGAPLKDWPGAHRGSLTEAALRAVFEPIMDALAYVHEHDMLHRDISPANIMIDTTGKPWLIDFGAFKEMWKGQPRRTTVQAANPGYAAPEQLDEMAGQGHGPFTDIFALSATMYEAIAGKKPASAMSRTVSLISQRPDPLEPLGKAASVPCSAAVIGAVTQGLALAPAARPQSIDEMRRAMGWIKGAATVAWREPPRAPRPPPPTPTTPPSPEVEEIIRTTLQLNPALDRQPALPLSPRQTWGEGRGEGPTRAPALAAAPHPDLFPPAGRGETRRRSRVGLIAGLLSGVVVADAIGVVGYNQYFGSPSDSAVTVTSAPPSTSTPARVAPTDPKPRTQETTPETPAPRKVATVPISRTGEPLVRSESKVLTTAEEAALKPKDEFQECEACPRMVVVPAGRFRMGSPPEEKDRSINEGPVHEVTFFNPFAVGKFEVTFAEWETCVRDGGCQSNKAPYDRGKGRGTRQPVVSVSWNDAQQYVAWLSRKTGKSYRLLRETEWEYATRAGSTTRFHFGDDDNQLPDYAWFIKNSSTSAQLVGQKRPNAFGLHDMHGNVWELLQDCYLLYSDQGPCGEDVVIRGGAWDHSSANLRSATRQEVSKTHSDDGVGFRIARTLEAQQATPRIPGIIIEERKAPDQQSLTTAPLPKQPVPKRAPNAPSPPSEAAPRSAKEQYEAAYGLLLQQNYLEAEKEFERFVSANPRHDLAPNAHFWAAEAMWVQGTHKRALAANYYATVIGQYPTHPKAQDSLLRLAAFYFDNNKNKQLACEQLDTLDARYPNAPAYVKSKSQSERQSIGC